MGMIQYSKDFQERILRFCKGIENLPNYEQKVKDHLDGPTSRLSLAEQRLCPEIQRHCGDCRDKTVLDFGCGTGASTAALAQIFQHVYAFDISEESIDISSVGYTSMA